MFPKDVVSGGTGGYYSSNDIWIIGRQQEKEGNELAGWNFIIKIEKSRMVQEGAKIPVTVSFNGGINRWSGLFDIALRGGYITNPKKGWYALKDSEKNFRQGDVDDNKEFWQNMFATTDLKAYIEKEYRIAHEKILEGND
jgi:hypothetical protein